MKPVILLFILASTFIYSCKKDSVTTNPNASLRISSDTIHFDTLFTTTGSVTHFFRIFNDNDQKLILSDVTLGGGSASYFKINADGVPGPSVSNLEVEANDSLYVFVTVKIDPTDENLPFIIQDSIGITFNGNRKWVQLDAWGQNAIFLREKIIFRDTTWTNEKPFVILGGLLVAEGAALNINEGTKIYLHADAPFVVDGTLNAVGNKYDSTKIVFRGDRIDEFYRDLPASWPGIYFREKSRNNMMKHVIVKNAYQGMVFDKPSEIPGPKATLEECIIDNCYDAGILGIRSSINAENCLISNCGKNIQLLEGGNYNFVHCTNVAISNLYISHKEPVLVITDFIKIGDAITLADVNADFTNCIFWGANGTVENEVITVREGEEVFNVNFKNCLWKVLEEPGGVTSEAMINNQDPLFENIDSRNNSYNFRLKEGSPAINWGINTGLSTDLDGNNRINIPDAGAYETTF